MWNPKFTYRRQLKKKMREYWQLQLLYITIVLRNRRQLSAETYSSTDVGVDATEVLEAGDVEVTSPDATVYVEADGTIDSSPSE